MPLITIATTTIQGWQGNTSGVVLRVYTNQAFTAQSGNHHPASVMANPTSLGTFFYIFQCTATVGSLTIPQVIIDSTIDSPDNPAASYTAVLWDTNSGKLIQSFGTEPTFSLSSAPSNTSWSAIFTAEEI